MRTGLLGSVALLLASAGLVFAEPNPPCPDGGQASAAAACTCEEPSTCAFCAHPTDNCCCEPVQTYFNAEYLLWFLKQPLPQPLVTTGTPGSGGVLGAPGTTVLLGGNGGRDEDYSGMRFTLGCWKCGGCSDLAVEGVGFFLDQRTTSVTAGSNAAGSPVLARPIINSLTGAETVHLIAFPGAFAGSVAASTTTQFWGAEANLIYNPFHITGNYPEYIVGFRYLDLHDHLDITDTSRILPGGVAFFNGAPVFAPNQLSTFDHFATRSQFFGGQIGLRSKGEFCQCFFVETIGKVAFGTTREEVDITGNTTLIPPTGPARTTTGGLLALASNIGHYSRNKFAIVPEGTLNVGCYVTPHIKTYVGFNILYWSEVFRAGDQVSRLVNPTFDPRSQIFGLAGGGPGRPAVQLQGRDDFWVYGLNAGIGFEF